MFATTIRPITTTNAWHRAAGGITATRARSVLSRRRSRYSRSVFSNKKGAPVAPLLFMTAESARSCGEKLRNLKQQLEDVLDLLAQKANMVRQTISSEGFT